MLVDAHLIKLRRINSVELEGQVGKLNGAAIPDDRAGAPALACREKDHYQDEGTHRWYHSCDERTPVWALQGATEDGTKQFLAGVAGRIPAHEYLPEKRIWGISAVASGWFCCTTEL